MHEDAIELTGLAAVQEKPQTAADSDDSDSDDDDSSRALLASHGRPLACAARVWPQVRGIVTESAPTLLFTTVGLLLTGKFLDQVSVSASVSSLQPPTAVVQHWHAMTEVHQLIMIIPVLLNLKGNLEMNLSARLCTAANIGQLDDPAIRRAMVTGNLALLQVQAAVVSFIAAWIAYLLGVLLPRGPPPAPAADNFVEKLAMVASTGMTAASLSSIALGSFMCFLIVLCRSYGRDPDNIAPPVASCLGDLVTLLWMSAVSATLIGVIHTPIPFTFGVLIACLASASLVMTLRNPHVRPLLSQGWPPLFGAMILSCGAGIVLDTFASRYEGFVLLSVVISDLPGSVGSILISRLSTSLHADALALSLTAPDAPAPRQSKAPAEPSTRLVMLTLALIALPVDVLFLCVLRALGWLRLPITFIVFSVVFFFCAELISLYVAKRLTAYLWAKDCDPDMYALPIHSAFMDLVGHILLAVCFEVVQLFIDVRVKEAA